MSHDPKTYNLPRLGGASYSNPLPSTDAAVHTRPDPFGFKHRGRYYTYATGVTGVTVSVSDDLVTWSHEGLAFELDDRRNYWAPCIIYSDGTFFLYVSSAPAESTDSHDERLHLATSDNPLGPFTLAKTFFDKFSIDPHVVRDRDGSAHIFYSTNDVTGLNSSNAGTSILVDSMVSLDELAGSPQAVVIPTLPEEIFEENRFGDGRDWYTIEGATFIRHRGTAYLTYSGNAYVRENYFVGYSRAVDNGSIAELNWTKYPSDDDFSPLIRRNDMVEGTGHNSIVTAPNLVDQWIMYHGRQAADPLTPDLEQRTMRIDPLFFDGDTLSTNAPSSAAQDAPAQPDVRDLFTGETLGDGWSNVLGSWTTGAHAAQTSASDRHSRAITTRSFGAYRAEIDVAATLDHAGARFGIVPVFFSDDDFVELIIDAGLQSVTALRVRNNIEHELARVPLPTITLSAFHTLQVNRGLDTVAVELDGVPLIDFAVPAGDASFGIVSTHTEARFSGFSIIGHLDLWGSSLAGFDRLFSADERAIVTAEGITTPTGRTLTLESLDTTIDTTYEYEFEMLSAARGRVDYFAEFIDELNFLKVEAHWHDVRVSRSVDGVLTTLAEASLPHPRFTVRTTVLDDRLTLRVASIHVLLPSSRSPFSHRVTLTASRLRGYAATSTQGSHQREER